ncbi:MAG: NAD-dependent epimerase/dehydratase family protein [Candidatus Saccharimonadales bacterium]
MKTVLVTGASGFIGKNLCSQLMLTDGIKVLKYTRNNTLKELAKFVQEADFIFHLAGVNRPKDEEDFTKDNQILTKHIIELSRSTNSKAPILLTSSTQANLDNPYGKSKLAAEKALLAWSNESNNSIYIYRLPGVFGKWSKPDYNSVVATFCYNIAHNLPVQVSDLKKEITLVYIDDVVDMFIRQLTGSFIPSKDSFYTIPRTFKMDLGDLKDRIIALRGVRTTLVVPNFEDIFNKFLYATYISYLSTNNFSYDLEMHVDNRGWLAEFIKSKQFGQVFISTTKPGISRGDHWHHTKIEKFLVVEGEAEISFRNKINSRKIIRYKVTGDKPTVLDMPTGYVHTIKNTGSTDLITIFWANEILDKNHPDTNYEKVEIVTGGNDE